MAQASIYKAWLEMFMPMLGTFVEEKTNGQNGSKLTYLHKERLNKVFSPDQKWEGTSSNNRYVKADYVELDSSLPLKKRGSISSSNGKLPKVGLKRQMKESDINSLNIMEAQLSNLAQESEAYKSKKRQIIKKLADDPTFCSIGIDEQNEFAYLYGISNGIVLVRGDENDSENTGIGMRVDYGYKPDHIFRTAVKDSCDEEDIQKVIDKADSQGNSIQHALVSLTLLNKIRKTRWAAELVANNEDKTYTEATKLPRPSKKAFLSAWKDEFGFELQVIDRTILCEKNGEDVPVKPFNPNRIIFLPNADKDGSLVWGELAEMTHPAEYVDYQRLDDFKLISRLRLTEPSLQELTKGQALVLPVIEDVDGIYVLDFSTAEELDAADSTEAGEVDAKITIAGKVYKKESVINALSNLGSDVKSTAKDSTVIKKINALSDEDHDRLMEAIKNDFYPETPPENG